MQLKQKINVNEMITMVKVIVLARVNDATAVIITTTTFTIATIAAIINSFFLKSFSNSS